MILRGCRQPRPPPVPGRPGGPGNPVALRWPAPGLAPLPGAARPAGAARLPGPAWTGGWAGQATGLAWLPAPRLPASRLPASRLPASRLPASRLPASRLPAPWLALPGELRPPGTRTAGSAGPGPAADPPAPPPPRNQSSGHSLMLRLTATVHVPIVSTCRRPGRPNRSLRAINTQRSGDIAALAAIRRYPLAVPSHQMVTTSRPAEARSIGCSGSTPASTRALATSAPRPGGRHSRRLVTSASSSKLA
jgi:hypothetical protein